jgi:hypothetical protein
MIDASDDISTLEAITGQMLRIDDRELSALAKLAQDRSAVVVRLAARHDLGPAEAARVHRVIKDSAKIEAKLRMWRDWWQRDAAECQRKQHFADELSTLVTARRHRLDVAG